MKKIIFTVALLVSALVMFGCKSPCSHETFTYDSDNTHHWKVCDLCGESFNKEVHDDHNFVKAGSTNIQFECSECNETFLKTINTKLKGISNSYMEIKDAEILKSLGVEPIKNASYFVFGVYPQTVKDDSVTILTPAANASTAPTTVHELAGHHSIYLGSDGEWYFRQQAAFVQPAKFLGKFVSTTYSTGKVVEENVQTYFKMEPVVWRKVILMDDEGLTETYLIADKCLEALPYYGRPNSSSRTDNGGKTILDNDYVNSDLYAFLASDCVNTLDNYKLFDYLTMTPNTCTGSLMKKMFFNTDSLNTNLEKFSVDEKDVYFAVPSLEQINEAYYRPENRVKKPTDYAIATGAKVDEKGYCSWWTRSPADINASKFVSIVQGSGSFYSSTSPNEINNVNNKYNGVVPYIKLKTK